MTIGRTRAAPALLLLLTFLDLWVLGRHRLIDVGPLRPLTEQSPVLARLAEEPRGTRIADPTSRNMPMLVGLAPISAYRTLNLPAVEALDQSAHMGPMSGPVFEPMVRAALRATGTGLRIFSPDGEPDRITSCGGPNSPARRSRIRPWPWLYGTSWAAEQGDWVQPVLVWRSRRAAGQGLVPPLDRATIDEPCWTTGRANLGTSCLCSIGPSRWPPSRARPEEWTILVRADEPGWVIVSQLHDPQWKARWIGLDGQGESDGGDPAGLPRSPANREAGSVSKSPATAAGRSAWSMSRATSSRARRSR